MLLVFAQVEWPSAIVAIVLLLIIASIMIIAMFRFDLDGVLKLWGAVGTVFGLVIGSMATYFFTNQAHQARTAQLEAEKRTLVAQQQAAVAEKESVLRYALAATEARERAKAAQEPVKGPVEKHPGGAVPAAVEAKGSTAAKKAERPE
jgi:hypothetical protein